MIDFIFFNAGVLRPEFQRNFNGEVTGQVISCRTSHAFTCPEMYPSVSQSTTLQEISY